MRSFTASNGARPDLPERGRDDGHARLRRDRQRKGQRAAVPSGAGDHLDRRARRHSHRLARGARRCRRHSDDHSAHPLRLMPVHGLHAQPRQPFRAHLLDRHPCRRRHRRDREHRPPLGDARRTPARGCRDRCRRRGRQSHHRRDADGGGRAPADAVRFGHDGALYEPDPGQCLGRHALFLLRRRHGDAVADAEDQRPACGRAPRT
jgi:hypothetical protein